MTQYGDDLSPESVHGDEWRARIRAEHERLGANCPCGNGGELAEVWCANDDRPAVVNRPILRNGVVEQRALCADCNWKIENTPKKREEL